MVLIDFSSLRKKEERETKNGDGRKLLPTTTFASITTTILQCNAINTNNDPKNSFTKFQFFNIIFKMPYYYPNEILYPDYTTFARPSDFNAHHQVYNYEKPIENTDYYMCKFS